MDTAELVCLVLILIVLVVALVLSCGRCWRSMGTIAGDAAAKSASSFPRDVSDQLRRSFRRATSGWGDRTETSTSSPLTISTVSADVIHGSDLHPVYLSPPRPHQMVDCPRRCEEGVRRTTLPGGGGVRDGTVNGIENPAYAADSVECGDVDTFNRTYIQLTNSGVVFPDDERQCIQSESYI